MTYTREAVFAVFCVSTFLIYIWSFTQSDGVSTYINAKLVKPIGILKQQRDELNPRQTLDVKFGNLSESTSLESQLAETWFPSILNEPYPYTKFYNTIRDYIVKKGTFPYHMVDNSSVFYFISDLDQAIEQADIGVSVHAGMVNLLKP